MREIALGITIFGVISGRVVIIKGFVSRVVSS